MQIGIVQGLAILLSILWSCIVVICSACRNATADDVASLKPRYTPSAPPFEKCSLLSTTAERYLFYKRPVCVECVRTQIVIDAIVTLVETRGGPVSELFHSQ